MKEKTDLIFFVYNENISIFVTTNMIGFVFSDDDY